MLLACVPSMKVVLSLKFQLVKPRSGRHSDGYRCRDPMWQERKFIPRDRTFFLTSYRAHAQWPPQFIPASSCLVKRVKRGIKRIGGKLFSGTRASTLNAWGFRLVRSKKKKKKKRVLLFQPYAAVCKNCIVVFALRSRRSKRQMCSYRTTS